MKEITHARFACAIREMKENKHRTRMTVGGNKITYPGDVSTPAAHLETAKLLFNSALSRPGARFMTLDLANFYLMTEINDFEYLRIKLNDMPEEIINECNLREKESNGWICIEIRKGAYGLPHAGVLAHKDLKKQLNDADYYEAITTLGLWRHKWRPIMFTLIIVDDFGVEYVGRKHVKHLIQTLKPKYDVTEDWSGSKFLGIDLEWDYNKRTVRLSMQEYIVKVLQRFNHTPLNKPTHSPHPHTPPTYGAKQQHAKAPGTTPNLSPEVQTKLQVIAGALLCYTRAVDNKILVALGTIATQTHAPTK